MSRLDIERQEKLEPVRIKNAIDRVEALGVPVQYSDNTKIQFIFKRYLITFFPYSGWYTGKSIKDGRGIDNLLKQLKQQP